jgi:hypothetical protein
VSPRNEDQNPQSASTPSEDQLVRRLRDLSWPQSSPEIRDRCWDDFRRRLATRTNGGESGEQGRNSEQRLEFTRRETAGGTPVSRERESIAQSASRRR